MDKKQMKMTNEASLYPTIKMFLEEKNYRVACEVPVGRFHPRVIDVVGIKGEEVVSVEAKLNHFDRTLLQASTRLFYSDKVFVAFPEKYAGYVKSAFHQKLKRTGIGLLSVDGIVIQEIDAQPSKHLNPKRRDRLIANAELKLRKR